MSDEKIDVLVVLERREARTFRAWKSSARRRDKLEGEARQVAHVKAQADEAAWIKARDTRAAVAEMVAATGRSWISVTDDLPEVGRPVWIANSTQAWIGWREEVRDGDDDQSDWTWSEAAYPNRFDSTSEPVARWCPIATPPALSS